MESFNELSNIDLNGYRLLVADDEPDIAELMREYLDELGAIVACVRNGEEVIETFLKQPEDYDLMVLDVKMPRLGGIEAYKEILKHKKSIPVIFLSGAIDLHGFLQENINKPYVSIINKPFKLDILAQQIFKMLMG